MASFIAGKDSLMVGIWINAFVWDGFLRKQDEIMDGFDIQIDGYQISE